MSFWTLRERGTGLVVRGRADDHAAVLEIVQRFDGPRSADLAARWLAAQPEGLSVVPSATGIDAFALQTIHPADPDLVAGDPVMRVALDMVERTAPARPGEEINISRFFGGAAQYQRDPYAVVAGAVSSTLLWTTRPLAWAFIATTDPEFWGPVFHYLALTTKLEADFDGRRHTLFGIDWRRLTPDRWFDLLGERELTGEGGPAPRQNGRAHV